MLANIRRITDNPIQITMLECLHMQICTSCGIEKEFSCFHKQTKSKTGFAYACKECVKEYSRLRQIDKKEELNARKRKYRKENIEISRAASLKYQKANPDKRKKYYQTRKERLKTGTLSSNIVEILYEKQKGICACCNLSLKDGLEKDHIVPLALGGLNVDENIQLLTPACNLKKSTLPPEIYLERIKFEK